MRDITSIIFHVAWQIVVKNIFSQKSVGNKSPNLKAKQFFGLVPHHSRDVATQGKMMDSHPSAPALHQPSHPAPPAKCCGRNHNNTPKTCYTLFPFPSQAPCNFQRTHKKTWSEDSLQATLPSISILNTFPRSAS